MLRLGLSPEYVLDKMQLYEVSAFMRYEHYAHKDAWEQTRMLAYMTAQMNSKKRLKPDDILPLYWEKEKGDTSISNEDIERLKKKAEQWQKAQPQ